MTTWMDDSLITDVKITTAPFNRSVTGYGGKIPTRYMLQISKRWHRVYVMQYSNSGTAWVSYKGQVCILESNTEYRIEKMVEGIGVPTPVAINTLTPGDRFRFQHDGVAATLIETTDGGMYKWSDYGGGGRLWAGTYSGTGKHAWPYVYPTTDPETEVKP